MEAIVFLLFSLTSVCRELTFELVSLKYRFMFLLMESREA